MRLCTLKSTTPSSSSLWRKITCSLKGVCFLSLITVAISVEVQAKTRSSFQVPSVSFQKASFITKKFLLFRAIRQHLTIAKKNKFQTVVVRKRRDRFKPLPIRKSPATYISKLNDFTQLNAKVGGFDRLYTKNLYGQRQTIAMIDFSGQWYPLRNAIKSGLRYLHPDLRQNYRRNFLPAIGGPHLHPEQTNSWIRYQAGDNIDHGSTISSIVLDLAPHAKVLPVSTYRFFDGGGQYELGDALLTLSKRKDVGIINVSGGDLDCDSVGYERGLNPDGTPKILFNHVFPKKHLDAFKAIARVGKVIVFASGNEGIEVMDDHVLHHYAKEWNLSHVRFMNFLVKNLDPETLKHVIFAGNIDPLTKRITKCSNRPGVRKEVQERWLCAPGRYIHAYNNMDGNGTSNSAPVICAAIANLMSKRGVTAKRAMEALLRTADQRPRERRAYGRGIIRADRASLWLDKN